MRPKKGSSLGANPTHQRLMLRNLSQSLFEHERIKTTEAKAKLLRPYAEKLITKAKKGSIHHRRQVLSVIEDRAVVHKLFAEIGPRFAERNGGYTRILKIGPRPGDGAPMAFVELVDYGATRTVADAPSDESPARRRLRRPGRRRQAGVAETTGLAPPATESAPPGEEQPAAESTPAPAEEEEPGGPSPGDDTDDTGNAETDSDEEQRPS